MNPEVWIIVAFLVIAVCGLFYQQVRIQRLKEKHQRDVAEARQDAVRKSRSTLEGNTFEKLVTHFKEWKYGSPSDARFIATPIDYVVFSGLSNDSVDEILFIEVKTGNSKETKRQRSVKRAIKEGKVRYELLEIQDES